MGQEAARQVIIADSKAAAHRQVLQERITILADHDGTGSYEFFVHEAEQGAGPPPHFHPWDEAFFVIEGEVEFAYGDRLKTLGPGGFIHFPAGTVHGFRYASPTARMAAISSRAGAAGFFTALDREVGAVPDFPKIVALANQHRVELPPPPGAPA
jgi:quercetin dioxygenase-like cupin family protein